MTQKTLKPRTMFHRDNLEVMRGINSNSVDLIYLDPPFNKGRNFHAPIGSTAEGAEFSDIWLPSSVKDEWHNELVDKLPPLYKYLDAVGDIGSRSAKYYLIYMAVRLLEMHRILKDDGSLFLHCDHTAGHYLKLLLDTIFGKDSLVNEIAWCYHGPGSPKQKRFTQKHDTIFWVAKSKQWTFNKDEVRMPYKDPNQSLRGAFDSGDGWDEEDLDKLRGRGKVPEDWWEIRIAARSRREYLHYPTQKPLQLLERIVRAASREGGLVLDPFCGCATTCVAAEKTGRQWIGIDVSQKAYDLVKMRLKKEVPASLFNPAAPWYRDDIPRRTDISHKKTVSKEDKQRLYKSQGGHCKGCGTHFAAQHLQIDHIIPRVAGGSNEADNLQLLCGNCNSIKGSRPMEYLKMRLKQLYRY